MYLIVQVHRVPSFPKQRMRFQPALDPLFFFNLFSPLSSQPLHTASTEVSNRDPQNPLYLSAGIPDPGSGAQFTTPRKRVSDEFERE